MGIIFYTRNYFFFYNTYALLDPSIFYVIK